MSKKIDQARHDAAVLPRIRDLEAGGLSLRQIADQLQADGFPTPGGRGRWSYMAVQRILARAGNPPGGGEAEQKSQAAVTITVNGAVNTNVPVAHQSGGEVTIEVASPPAPPTMTNPHVSASTGSLIELAEANAFLSFPPWPYLRQYGQILGTLDLARTSLNPFFLRRRV